MHSQSRDERSILVRLATMWIACFGSRPHAIVWAVDRPLLDHEAAAQCGGRLLDKLAFCRDRRGNDRIRRELWSFSASERGGNLVPFAVVPSRTGLIVTQKERQSKLSASWKALLGLSSRVLQGRSDWLNGRRRFDALVTGGLSCVPFENEWKLQAKGCSFAFDAVKVDRAAM